MSTLLSQFGVWVSATPDAVALRCGAASLSYAELDRRATCLAAGLREHGLGNSNELVAIRLPAGVGQIIAMLGIWKAGCAYLPLDSSPEREARIAAAAKPAFTINPDEFISLCETAVPDGWQDCAQDSTGESLNAYTMFTSGSSGEPKGVVVTHANIAGLFASLERPTFSAADVWSQSHSIAFGFSVWEIWGALAHGGCLLVVPQELRRDPQQLQSLLDEHHVTVFSTTPSGFSQWLALDDIQVPAKLETIVFSGEAVVPAAIAAWFGRTGSNVRLFNTYALTETAGRVCVSELRRDQSLNSSVIGTPVADARLRVVGEDGNPVAAGESGELIVSGPMVATGYLDDPQLTADRFFDDAEYGRSYRSGDRVKELADGRLEFVGRVDGQIKLRGYRVEPGEIEQVIRNTAGVRDAVVAPVERAGETQLAAWYVPTAEAPAEGEPEFWPSLGEYQIYDELLYEFMNADETRVAAYREAFEQVAPGKVVLDIGCGQDCLLARMAVAAGARQAYAVEVLPAAAARAAQLVARQGLSDRIEVICGDMRDPQVRAKITEPVDVVTQGIIGNIGSSDGIVPIWNFASPVFGNNYQAVPARCTTRLAAVELPAGLQEPKLTGLAAQYTEKVFSEAGRRFDVRLCVRNFPDTAKLTNDALFEDLDFQDSLLSDETGSAQLQVQRGGRFDGLLLWTEVETLPGQVVDFLDHQQAWLPVYLPVLDGGVTVAVGDTVGLRWSRTTGADGVFPDYSFTVIVNGEQLGDYPTAHDEAAYRRNPFYDTLHTNLDTNSTAAELREQVAAQLPEYMQPKFWMALPALPLNESGKLDRAALPVPLVQAVQTRAPETALQRDLVDILQRLLDREQSGQEIGIDEDFFDAGGDSIAAVRFTTEVQRLLDDTVFLAALFEAPTVAAYAGYLEANHAEALLRRYSGKEIAGAAADQIPAVAGDGPAPLSYAQQSLWFLDRLYTGSTAANEQFALRLSGEVDPDRLSAVWQQLSVRHSILRTRFSVIDHEPVQVVDSKPQPLRTVNDTSVDELAAVEIAQHFDLHNGPLLSACWLPAEQVLLVTVHHILADGLSVELIRNELAALYSGEESQMSALPEPALQFRDFAIWERSLGPDSGTGFWQQQLSGADMLLGLPQAVSEGIVTVTDVHRGFQLDAAVADRLRSLAREQGASLFMLVVAVYRIALARLSGQQDVLIGSPATLRTRPELQEMIGCMVNNLPLRAPLADSSAFRDVLSVERDAVLQALDHAGVPLETIVDALDPPREFGRHPLFQALLMYEDRSAPAVDSAGINWAVEVPHAPRPSYWDVEVTATDNGSGKPLRIDIGMQTARYDAVNADVFSAVLAELFNGVAANPDARWQQLPLPVAGTVRPPLALSDDVQPLHRLFERQAERTPESPAIITDAAVLSYKELNAQANAIAAQLIEAGVTPGERVAVQLLRSPERVAAVLAVLKAGAVVVPVDPGWPAQRTELILCEAQPVFVLDAGKLAGCLQGDGLKTANPGINVPADAPVWVLFTSGSTGTPKGVVYSHRAAATRICWMWESFDFAVDDRFLHRTSLNFVDAWWELFGALGHGAAVVVPPQAADADARRLAAQLAQHQVTHLVAVPSLLSALLDMPEGTGAIAKLRHLITSGETLGTDTYRQLLNVAPDCQVLNTYGTTETWDISCHRCALTTTETQPVGTPLPGVSVHVLDRWQQPLPQGVWGELFVSGWNLPLECLNGRGQDLDGGGLTTVVVDGVAVSGYLTGDVGRYLENGELVLGGRKDRQLKLRGLRVNPAEVEFHLRQHPQVHEAAVMAVADGSRQWLVAWITGATDVTKDDLQMHLRGWLPDVMIPEHFESLGALPLTPSGKTDYLCLPAPDWRAARNERDYVAPVSDTEKQLAVIWQDVLGVEQVGRFDDFFALRGHSLMAARLMSRVCDVFAADLPLQCLFEHPTLAGLAKSIDTLRWAAAGDEQQDAAAGREVLRF